MATFLRQRNIYCLLVNEVYKLTRMHGAIENARPENDGVENDGQIPKELQGLENARLENDGQTYSNSVLYM